MQTQSTAAARKRYLALIDATLRVALAGRSKSPPPDGLTMELALPAIADRLDLLRPDDRSARHAAAVLAEAQPIGPVADGAGQTRPVYRPLLMRAHLSLAIGSPDATSTYLTRAASAVERFAGSSSPPDVSDGGFIAATLLDAVILQQCGTLGDPAWTTHVNRAFDRVIAHQQPDGLFLRRTSANQLEPAWYDELAVLHAVALYARSSDRAASISAVQRSARYHAEQVQPDHASSHPFALAPLLDDAEGIHLADMMLHAAGVQQPATMDAVCLVLLADALDCGGRAEPA